MTAAIPTRFRTKMTLHALTAGELMVPNPISIREEADISEALSLFTEKSIAAAPVIDEAGRPIGVVSRSDLLIHERECEKVRAGKAEYFTAPSFEAEPGEALEAVVLVERLAVDRDDEAVHGPPSFVNLRCR